MNEVVGWKTRSASCFVCVCRTKVLYRDPKFNSCKLDLWKGSSEDISSSMPANTG